MASPVIYILKKNFDCMKNQVAYFQTFQLFSLSFVSFSSLNLQSLRSFDLFHEKVQNFEEVHNSDLNDHPPVFLPRSTSFWSYTRVSSDSCRKLFFSYTRVHKFCKLSERRERIRKWAQKLLYINVSFEVEAVLRSSIGRKDKVWINNSILRASKFRLWLSGVNFVMPPAFMLNSLYFLFFSFFHVILYFKI